MAIYTNLNGNLCNFKWQFMQISMAKYANLNGNLCRSKWQFIKI